MAMSMPALETDRRKTPRTSFGNVVARVDACDGREPILCCLWDLSAEGACLMLPPEAQLPPTFDLMLDDATHRVTIMWRHWSHVGVRFAEPLPNV